MSLVVDPTRVMGLSVTERMIYCVVQAGHSGMAVDEFRLPVGDWDSALWAASHDTRYRWDGQTVKLELCVAGTWYPVKIARNETYGGYNGGKLVVACVFPYQGTQYCEQLETT